MSNQYTETGQETAHTLRFPSGDSISWPRNWARVGRATTRLWHLPLPPCPWAVPWPPPSGPGAGTKLDEPWLGARGWSWARPWWRLWRCRRTWNKMTGTGRACCRWIAVVVEGLRRPRRRPRHRHRRPQRPQRRRPRCRCCWYAEIKRQRDNFDFHFTPARRVSWHFPRFVSELKDYMQR